MSQKDRDPQKYANTSLIPSKCCISARNGNFSLHFKKPCPPGLSRIFIQPVYSFSRQKNEYSVSLYENPKKAWGTRFLYECEKNFQTGRDTIFRINLAGVH